MYALIANQAVKIFPYSVDDFKKDHRQTSFPLELSQELLASYGVFPVVGTEAQYDPTTQIAEPNGCAFNVDRQRWETAWTVRSMTAEEIQQCNDTQAAQVRSERNARLADSDWTQVADAPVDQAAWAAYRQALRDITAQAGFPQQVVWPQEPNQGQ